MSNEKNEKAPLKLGETLLEKDIDAALTRILKFIQEKHEKESKKTGALMGSFTTKDAQSDPEAQTLLGVEMTFGLHLSKFYKTVKEKLKNDHSIEMSIEMPMDSTLP